MEKSEIREAVHHIIKTYLLEDIDIEDDMSILRNDEEEKSLNLSSMDYVEFIVKIEEAFDLIYNFEEDWVTVHDVIDYIEKAKRE